MFKLATIKDVRSMCDDEIQILWSGEDQTYYLLAGCYEPGYIDLFDLQRWFDDNRKYVDSLKKKD